MHPAFCSCPGVFQGWHEVQQTSIPPGLPRSIPDTAPCSYYVTTRLFSGFGCYEQNQANLERQRTEARVLSQAGTKKKVILEMLRTSAHRKTSTENEENISDIHSLSYKQFTC